MKSLECSSRGYKPLSAFYAMVKIYGKLDSIENHYQNAKRDYNNNPVGKGKPVHHMYFEGIKFRPEYLSAYYKILWVKYLDEHPKVVSYASNFDTFTDMFRGKSINCQADVINDYIKHGRSYILEDKKVQEFLYILKCYRMK